jgi:hypothetical protein
VPLIFLEICCFGGRKKKTSLGTLRSYLVEIPLAIINLQHTTNENPFNKRAVTVFPDHRHHREDTGGRAPERLSSLRLLKKMLFAVSEMFLKWRQRKRLLQNISKTIDTGHVLHASLFNCYLELGGHHFSFSSPCS